MTTYHLNEEEELIKRCVKNERKAQKILYDRYAPLMLSLCLRYVRSADVAQDVLQDGFVKVFSKISEFRFQGSFEGWLRRVFVTTSLELLRKNDLLAYAEDVSQIEKEDELVYDVIDTITANEILNVIADLPDGYRTVFNLFAIEGYSHKEIASILQITETTSCTQFLRARKALQTKLIKLYSLDVQFKSK